MSTTQFVNGSTLTDEGWFNDVDAITYDGTTSQMLVGGGTGTIAAWTTATGSGSPVRGTSPSFTTSVVSASTTLAVFNTVATTVNAFGDASVAINMGHASGTNTILGASTFSQALTATSGIVLPSTAANITLGANFISYGGTDAGFSLDASNNATLSGTVRSSGSTGFLTLGSGGQDIRLYGGSASHQWDIYGNGTNLRIGDNTGGGSVVIDTPLAITGALTGVTTGTFSGNLIFSAGDRYLLANTSDASDSYQIGVVGGGSASVNRGALVLVAGNEHSTSAGDVDIYAGNVAGGSVNIYTGNAALTGSFTTTGLNATVIGATTAAAGSFTTLAASGQITSTSSSGTVLTRTGAATLQQQIIIGNTTGLMYIGVESSSGGTIATGSTAYATVLASETNTPVQIGVNGALEFSFNSGGASRSLSGIRIGADSTNNLLDDASNGAGTATLYIGNASINVTSDERIKTNVREWDGDASAILKALPVKAWDKYLSDAPQGGYEGGYVGFTAQDMHKVAPWSVNTQGDTGLPWQARYEFLNGIIVKGMQQIMDRLDKLEK